MNKKKILIVEDDNSLRTLLSCILNRHYDVTAKKDGFDGMSWLDYGNLPDIILMDLNMPKFDGFNFLNNLRQSGFYRYIPVIALSGTDRAKEISRFYELGGNEFLSKPFNPADLFNTLDKYITVKQ